MLNQSRYLSKKDKQTIITRQKGKCINSHSSNLRFIVDYECPWWKNKETNGLIDKGKYDFDHITEYSLGGSSDPEKFQLICLSCHRERTNNFKKYKAERQQLNIEIRILQTRCKQLDKKFNANPNELDYETDQSSKMSESFESEIDPVSKCEQILDKKYDKTTNYSNDIESLKLKLDMEKERTHRTIIEKEKKELSIKHELIKRNHDYESLLPKNYDYKSFGKLPISFEKMIDEDVDEDSSSDEIEHDWSTVNQKITKHVSEFMHDKDVVSHATTMFLFASTQKIKVKNDLFYVFLPDKKLYKPIGCKKKKETFGVVIEELTKRLKEARSLLFCEAGDLEGKKQKDVIDRANSFTEFLKATQSKNVKILDAISKKIIDKRFASKLDSDISVMNFSNGKIGWTTGIFEQRNQNDFVSHFIDTIYVHKKYETSLDEKNIRLMCDGDVDIYNECLDLITLKISSREPSLNSDIFRMRWTDIKISLENKKRLLEMFNFSNTNKSLKMIHLLLSHHMSHNQEKKIIIKKDRNQCIDN